MRKEAEQTALSHGIQRFCKDLLRQYPLLRKELMALEEEKEAIAGAAPIATWQEEQRSQTLGDRTATQVMRLLRLEEAWSKTRFYARAVEDVLTYLDTEKRWLVELRYFKDLSIQQVARELCVDESTARRYQRTILALLAHRLGL